MSTQNSAPAKFAISGMALVTALVVLVAFGVFVWYMIAQRNAQDVTWARLSWLFASVEAIAFGAAGALFGSSIQRQRAEKAENAAAANAEAASRGAALAAVLKADGPGRSGAQDPNFESLGPVTAQSGVHVAARHAALARELFP